MIRFADAPRMISRTANSSVYRRQEVRSSFALLAVHDRLIHGADMSVSGVEGRKVKQCNYNISAKFHHTKCQGKISVAVLAHLFWVPGPIEPDP